MRAPVGRLLRRVAGVLLVLPLAASGALTPASPAAAADATVTLTGHGYGHGRGMSQYGAYGYAVTYGWSAAKIVQHFYGGTTLTPGGTGSVTVRLMALENVALTVTSGSTFVVGGKTVAGGSAATITPRPDGKFTVTTRYSCSGAGVSSTVTTSNLVRPTAAPATLGAMLTVCSTKRTYRGTLSVLSSSGTHVVNTVSMEDYLRGVIPRESPASWGDAGGGKGREALKAQAIAARSYAWSEQRTAYAKTCDTTSCQVYGGAGLNGAVIEDPRTNAAVASTAGQVLRWPNGTPVRAEFSSSSGGWTAGGAFPAVQDLGDSASPRHNWSVTRTASQIGSAFGVGVLRSITVTKRNGLGADGGRVLSLRVSGSSGTVDVTGNEARTALGLYSDWFVVPPPAQPPTFYLSNSPAGLPVASRFAWGNPGDQPFACDWNGDGTDGVGLYRGQTVLLRAGTGGTGAVSSFQYGRPGDVPVCGDWNGDGKDSIGVYRPGTRTFYLRNSMTFGAAEITVVLGRPGDVPVVGDWTDGGRAGVGVYRPSEATFYLRLPTGPSAGTVSAIRYGDIGDVPVVGDWNGDGRDTLGVHRDELFLLTDGLGGAATRSVRFGFGDDLALSGNWDGAGGDTVGVARAFDGSLF